MCFDKLCGLLCIFWGGSHAHQIAAYGLSINGLTPHLFSPDSTPTPIFQRKHLDVTLSTFFQLFWTTYLRPVLSGPRSFQTLDDLSHCAAAQFQGSCSATIRLLRSSEFFVMLELLVKSVRAVLQMRTSLLSLCTHGPSNTKMERKWQAVLNLDIVLS